MTTQPKLEKVGKTRRIGAAFTPWMIYPFFMVHMLAFGLSGFFMAYSDDHPDISFLYMHGGIAIVVYLVFYLAIFGRDQVKWMFINAGLGLLGIYTQIDLILSIFGKNAGDFPVSVHVVPFLYYILYTFLLYQFVLQITGAHNSTHRRKIVENVYVVSSVLVYGGLYLMEKIGG
jgi:hypothetical protein